MATVNFIINESEQKLRGGYYTPRWLADYVAAWALGAGARTVLEPSCGDGVFVDAVSHGAKSEDLRIKGFELESGEAKKSALTLKACKNLQGEIVSEDFLPWAIREMLAQRREFDAVVGNPPFIRYQYLDKAAQQHSEAIFKILGLPFTKHTNAWVPFVLASVAMLRPGGRLGMILPAEIIHVRHAGALRSYLGSVCSRLLLIDPEEIWFENTLQGAVILLAEKRTSGSDHCDGVGIHQVTGRSFVRESSEHLFARVPRINGLTIQGKWTRALLSKPELNLFDRIAAIPDVHQFSDIASVDVGIVTGANDFFLVDDQTVSEYRLEKYARPMFGRSEHCPGVIYDAAQHRTNAQSGYPTNFLWFDRELGGSNKKALDYIQSGERRNLHTRYKCRIRTPWYRVPSVYPAKVGLLKRSHDMPRLILNRIGALTTDTSYRIRTKDVNPEKLVSCFINPLTALSSELEGRHYGGGVLELVPSEIESLLVPVPKKSQPSLAVLDKAVRNQSAEEVLASHGTQVLISLGLKASEGSDLLASWKKLRNRRQRVSEE